MFIQQDGDIQYISITLFEQVPSCGDFGVTMWCCENRWRHCLIGKDHSHQGTKVFITFYLSLPNVSNCILYHKRASKHLNVGIRHFFPIISHLSTATIFYVWCSGGTVLKVAHGAGTNIMKAVCLKLLARKPKRRSLKTVKNPVELNH